MWHKKNNLSYSKENEDLKFELLSNKKDIIRFLKDKLGPKAISINYWSNGYLKIKVTNKNAFPIYFSLKDSIYTGGSYFFEEWIGHAPIDIYRYFNKQEIVLSAGDSIYFYLLYPKPIKVPISENSIKEKKVGLDSIHLHFRYYETYPPKRESKIYFLPIILENNIFKLRDLVIVE